MGSLTDSLTPIDCFYHGSQKRLIVRRKVEPAPLNRSWRGRPVCYRKLNKHLSACTLGSAQWLRCLRVWAPTQVSKFSRTIYSPNKSCAQLLNTIVCDHPQSMYSPLKLSIMHNEPGVWPLSHDGFHTMISQGRSPLVKAIDCLHKRRYETKYFSCFLFFTVGPFETRDTQPHTFYRIYSFQVA